MKSLCIVVLFVLSACSASTAPVANHATPSAEPSTASKVQSSGSPSAQPSGSPSAAPSSGLQAVTFSCVGPVPVDHALALVTLIGSDRTVVRDVSNPAHGQTICTFAGRLENARFVSATRVGYVLVGGGPAAAIYIADLAAGTSRLVRTLTDGIRGLPAWSPDGNSFSYVDEGSSSGPEWHLITNGTDRMLVSLPIEKLVDTDPDWADLYLSFSGDGTKVAFLQRLAAGPTGDPFATLDISDLSGTPLIHVSGVTMATWSRQYLYFYDNGMNIVRFFQPGTRVLGGVGLSPQWVQPSSSPDGRYIAYTTQLSEGAHHVRLYDTNPSTDNALSTGPRVGAVFLSQDLIWYAEETPCQSVCPMGGPVQTGRTFIYDLASRTEAASVISFVYDSWPHLGSGRLNRG